MKPEYVILEGGLILTSKVAKICEKYNIRLGIQFHNIYTNYYSSILKSLGLPKKIIRSIPLFVRISKTEMETLKHTSIKDLYFVSVSDMNLMKKPYLRSLNTNQKFHIIPNGYLQPKSHNYKEINTLKRKIIGSFKYISLFIGSKNNLHNRQAVKNLYELAKHMNDQQTNNLKIMFIIIGSGWGYELHLLPNLKVIGEVEDIDLYTKTADFAVLPMSSGGGTKLKTINLVKNLVPIFGTKLSVQGLNFENKKHYIKIDSKNIEKTIQIIKYSIKEKSLIKISLNARKQIENLNWLKISEKLSEIILRK